MKQIQIPESLFYDLVLYHLYDMTEPEERIRKALNDKMEAVLRRECYTQYKTAPDEAKREEARKAYLESAGILPGFCDRRSA